MRTRSAEARWVGESWSRGETRRTRAGSYVEGSEIKATRRVEEGSSFPDPGRAEIIPGTCHRLLFKQHSPAAEESDYALGAMLFCCMAAVSGASAITTAKPLESRVSG